MKRMICYLLMAAMFISLAACGGTTPTEPFEQEIEVVSENILRFSLQQLPVNFDANSDKNHSPIFTNCFETLVQYYNDGKLYAAAATSYHHSEDGLNYTFNLPEDGMWSDGSPLTAQHFVDAFVKVLNPKESKDEAKLLLGYILKSEEFQKGEVNSADIGVQATDKYTLEIILEKPLPQLLDILTMEAFYPINTANEADFEAVALAPDAFLTNGAFKIFELLPGERITLCKNENYKNNETVFLDKIEFPLIEKSADAKDEYLADKIDGFAHPDPQSLIDLNNSLIKTSLFSTEFITFNFKNRHLANVGVRKALNLAIDRNAIISELLGNGTPAFGLVAPGYVTEDIDFIETRDKFGISNLADVELAQKELSAAGYWNSTGFPEMAISFVSNERSKKLVDIVAKLISENLGLKITAKEMTQQEYDTAIQNGSFDMAYQPMPVEFLNPYAVLPLFNSKSPQNIGKYNRTSYDTFAADFTNPKKTTDSMQSADKLLGKEYAALWIYHPINNLVISSTFTNITQDKIGRIRLEKAVK